MNNYDIFISYKRRGSSLAAAPYLFELLRQRGYNVFLDTKEMRSGRFDEQLLEYISGAKDVIILLEEESLASWFSDNYAGRGAEEDSDIAGSSAADQEPAYRRDWFCREVMHALSQEGKNIIPLLLNGYRMPDAGSLPPEMALLPTQHAVEVDFGDMEHLIQKNFIEMEYLRSKPTNLALSRRYLTKGGTVASFLFYTDESSCELSENGEKILTLTEANDELHPFIYNVSIAGEHRFHLFNNDTCEKMVIRQRVEPSCQEFVPVIWEEKQSLWELTESMISDQEDPQKLFFWGTSLFNGTAKNAPDLNRAVSCLERAVGLGYAPACDFMKENGGISPDAADNGIMLRWYTLATGCGSVRACNSLGLMYKKGDGVEKSAQKAAELFSMAADKGFINSMNNLAAMCNRGEVVGMSHEKAEELYRAAADRGSSRAYNGLAWTLHLMDRYDEALPWAEKALAARPDNPGVVDTMATVLQGLGRYDEALAMFQECLRLYKERDNYEGIARTDDKIAHLKSTRQ